MSISDGVLKYGIANDLTASMAIENFVKPMVNGLSICCTPIEMLSNDGKNTVISTATGFFWRHNGRPYLVTNWHVISGRNPFTGSILSPSGYVPNRIRFYGIASRKIDKNIQFERRQYEIKWDQNGEELFSKPPSPGGIDVDIWAYPIPDEIIISKSNLADGFAGANTSAAVLNEHNLKDVLTMAGDDCVIIGYPLKNYDGLSLPIWKRGMVASESTIGVDGRPIFMVDSAVTPSMSGSPILRRAKLMGVADKDMGLVREVEVVQVIGVYAGRLQSSDLESTNLGYGWYRSFIDKVIDFYNYKAAPMAIKPV